MAATITWLGEPESNLASTTWGNDTTGTVLFPLNQPVLVDPSTATGEKRRFLNHIIDKASRNRFFKVEDAKEGQGAAATVKDAPPKARTQPNPRRGAKASAQSDDEAA